ncbi:MAG: NUDIX domain-containing protein [Ilumatobacteraceae bacterium]
MTSPPPFDPSPRVRQSVRALIVDPDDRVLLVRLEFPDASVWALPGGGVEPDEEPLDALRRELAEELGLVDVDIGPHVWDRLHMIRFEHGRSPSGAAPRWDGQRDRIHLVCTGAFEPRPHLSWDELRTERLHEIRWWTLADVRAHPGRFAPRRLARHLAALLHDGPPPSPIDTGE